MIEKYLLTLAGARLTTALWTPDNDAVKIRRQAIFVRAIVIQNDFLFKIDVIPTKIFKKW